MTNHHRIGWARPIALTALVGVSASIPSCRGASPTVSRNGPVTLALGMPLPDPVNIRQILGILSAEGLVSTDQNGRILPNLADTWNTSEDGLLWRFKLRPSVQFQDGTVATATVVADALRRAVADLASLARPPLVEILEVSAEGDQTVRVRLGRPSSVLLDALATQTLSVRGKGSGPFSVRSTATDLTELVAFPDYHGGKPAIDRIDLRTYHSHRMAWAALLRGDLDCLLETSREALDFVKAETTVTMYFARRPYVHTLVFNLRHPVLRKTEVRRALNYAVNRKEVVELALRGEGEPAVSNVWPSHWTYDTDLQPYQFDPGFAIQALDDAGYPAPEPAVIKAASVNQLPSRFSFKCLIPSGYPVYEKEALVVQKQLYQIGVDMKVEVLPFEQISSRLSSGDFDAVLLPVGAGRGLSWPFKFWHSPVGAAFIDSGYSAADESLEALRAAFDEQSTREAATAFQRKLYYDPPAIFLCWDRATRALSRRFAVPNEPDRDILYSIWRWTPTSYTARKPS